MKNLVAASFVTGALVMNLFYAVMFAAAFGEARLISQGFWLIPSVAWLIWAINRSHRSPSQPPANSVEADNEDRPCPTVEDPSRFRRPAE